MEEPKEGFYLTPREKFSCAMAGVFLGLLAYEGCDDAKGKTIDYPTYNQMYEYNCPIPSHYNGE
tara:strand:- start:2341 stop:2532 length:192 start_codon:yes stop_codon:yes gene_type:complete